MGYYTDYRIEHDGNANLTPEVHTQLERIAGYSFEIEGDNELRNYHTKWYEHEEQMKELSLLHPEVLFTVEGNGEAGDQWRRYYKYGKVQTAHAEITFPPFDESRLE